ncbi:MAG: thioredoxin [Oscillospiraceae bacterium]|nr:thioredoxin [Oscillospiraceae bacterium]
MPYITLTKDNFAQEVLRSEKPVLVDFWASWCGPCMALAPTIDEIAGEQTQVKVGKVNVDEEPELSRQYRIMSIPTLMVFRNGEPVCREVGGKSKEEILEMIGLDPAKVK